MFVSGVSEFLPGYNWNDLLQEAGGWSDHRVRQLVARLEECLRHLQLLHHRGGGDGARQHLVHQTDQEGGCGRCFNLVHTNSSCSQTCFV